MSTAVWPPIAPAERIKEENASLARELDWLLESLQDTLRSLKEGLDEVAALLAPSENGSTLVVSSHRSESVKGFITRVGTRIVKGDVKLQLASLPPPRGANSYPVSISTEPHAPTLVLNELTSARTMINACLDVVDVSAWAGDPKDASFIAGQLRLLDVNLQEAKAALRGETNAQPPWYKNALDESTFTPPLPVNVSFHLSLKDAAIILEIRVLEVAGSASSHDFSSFSLRDRLGFAFGGSRAPAHDEVDEVFTWKGQDAKVRDKVRVESSDPNLMAALAKMNALERTVALSRRGLDTVLGKDDP